MERRLGHHFTSAKVDRLSDRDVPRDSRNLELIMQWIEVLVCHTKFGRRPTELACEGGLG